MARYYKPIKDQLYAILQGVSSLQAVYAKEEKALNDGGYPAATIEGRGHQAQYYSIGPGGSNQRVIEHYIRIYFRTDETNNPDYEDVLENTVDDVLNAIEQNITLNGACLYAIPSSGIWKNGQKENPVRYLEIVVSSTIQAPR